MIKHKGDWRLGAEKYRPQFAAALGIDTPPDTLLADAERELERVRGEMLALATPMYDKLFPGQPHGDSDKLIRRVLDRIAETHAKPNTYFDDAKRDLAEVTAFIRQKDFVPMPSNSNLQVIADGRSFCAASIPWAASMPRRPSSPSSALSTGLRRSLLPGARSAPNRSCANTTAGASKS